MEKDFKSPEVKAQVNIESIDLGKRAVQLDGVYYKGIVKSTSPELIASLKAELAKPQMYQVDIGDVNGELIVLNIGGNKYSGIVETESKSLRDELIYRASMVKEGDKRQHSSRAINKTYQDINNPPKNVVILKGGQ